MMKVFAVLSLYIVLPLFRDFSFCIKEKAYEVP